MGRKMTVQGVNGNVVTLDESVAAGLIDAGHVQLVSEDGQDEQSQDETAQVPPSGVELTGQPVTEPAGNASTEDWATYARFLGYDEEQLDGLGRDDIKKLVDN